MGAKRIRNGVYEYVFRHRLLGDQPVVRRFHRAEDGDRFASEMERALKRGFVPAALLEDQEPLRSRRRPVETLRALMISYRYNCSIKPEDHYLLTLLEERLPKDLGIDQIDYDWAESFVRSLKLDYNPAPGTSGSTSARFTFRKAQRDSTCNFLTERAAQLGCPIR